VRRTRALLTSRAGRLLAGIVVGSAIAALVVTTPSDRAGAADRGKVTLCHRTHSPAHPYRRITVNVSAANGSGPQDHTHHTGGPFDPTTTAPANDRDWGDIIPDRTAGGAGSGLNWTPVGQAIYGGTPFGGVSYAGLCVPMTAQEFYDDEVTSGQDPTSVLHDLDEQQADDDASLRDEIGSFTTPTGTSPEFSTGTTSTTTSTSEPPTATTELSSSSTSEPTTATTGPSPATSDPTATTEPTTRAVEPSTSSTAPAPLTAGPPTTSATAPLEPSSTTTTGPRDPGAGPGPDDVVPASPAAPIAAPDPSPDPAAPGIDLAFTGSPTLDLLTLAFGLALIGLVLVAATRASSRR
jgi:hypothetical protein